MKPMSILVCAAGPISGKVLKNYKKKYNYVVAVDGGYDKLVGNGFEPNIYIGDLDSVESEITCQKVLRPKEKDESDFKLAIDYIFNNFTEVGDITIAGVISEKRFDHTLSNLFTLLEYNRNITILSNSLRVLIFNKTGEYRVNSKKGDRVSIFTFSDSRIEASGLKYNLPLKFKFSSHGISNIAISSEILINVKRGKYILMIFNGSPN